MGRIYIISPREEERYFLRTLLLHISGLTSFKGATTVDGIQYSSFRQASCAMGLRADDAERMTCLKDAFESTFEPLTTLLQESFHSASLPAQLVFGKKLGEYPNRNKKALHFYN